SIDSWPSHRAITEEYLVLRSDRRRPAAQSCQHRAAPTATASMLLDRPSGWTASALGDGGTGRPYVRRGPSARSGCLRLSAEATDNYAESITCQSPQILGKMCPFGIVRRSA